MNSGQKVKENQLFPTGLPVDVSPCTGKKKICHWFATVSPWWNTGIFCLWPAAPCTVWQPSNGGYRNQCKSSASPLPTGRRTGTKLHKMKKMQRIVFMQKSEKWSVHITTSRSKINIVEHGHMDLVIHRGTEILNREWQHWHESHAKRPANNMYFQKKTTKNKTESKYKLKSAFRKNVVI